jgi:hypothetical protein
LSDIPYLEAYELVTRSGLRKFRSVFGTGPDHEDSFDTQALWPRGTHYCISCVPPESRRAFLHRPTDLRMKLEEAVPFPKVISTADKHYM